MRSPLVFLVLHRGLTRCASLRVALILSILMVGACVPLFRSVSVEEVSLAAPGDSAITDGIGYDAPARAFLSDGSIVVLPFGGRVEGQNLVGRGWRSRITLLDSIPFYAIPTDSVIGVEIFRGESENLAGTVVLTAASTVATATATFAVGAALAAAVFGSCPTIYALADGQEALQMEAFSYSIAPLFESRDVAALSAKGSPLEPFALMVRNEALETHYINHLALLEVTHGPEERALPDPNGRPVVIGPGVAPLRATDRGGRDVTALLAVADEQAFRSSRDRLAAASLEDLTDYLDIVIPVPHGASEVTLALQLRNTLLNSVLFYDVMLAESGVGALDWLSYELDRIGGAMELGTWYQRRMGMRVLIEDDGEWRKVEHLGDVGPIAWKEVALRVPVSGAEETQRVRLEFVSDSWFIDRVQISGASRRPDVKTRAVSRVVDSDGSTNAQARIELQAPDAAYLATYPGQALSIEFDPSSGGVTGDHTLLLVAQGYYVEWVRGSWLGKGGSGESFRPSDSALLRAMTRWDDVLEDFERDFHATRISAR